MKTKFLFIVCFITLTCYAINANSQANTELSNLISPTKVNQSLVPITHSKPTFFNPKTGQNNTASGQYALYSYTTGFANTATGNSALFSNTSGFSNTATGTSALYYNTTEYGNTAIGSGALWAEVSGELNTATGSSALGLNYEGSYNTANGYDALGQDNYDGNSNTANGNEALAYNNGSYNTANGHEALSNTHGYGNTACGGMTGEPDSYNVYGTSLGYDVDNSIANSTALGSNSFITYENQVKIGDQSVTSIGGYEPWTNLSDGRFKKNVKDNVPGLAFINELRAITYTIDVTSLTNFVDKDRQDKIMRAEGKTVREKNPEAEALIQKGIQEKEKMIRTGFVAQEVEEAAKRIGYDFSGVDKPKNEHTPYGLRYSEFVVPLVKAVQELSKTNDELKKQNEAQKKEIAELKAVVLSNNHR